uniref:ubiquitinyl hydrolase 1 n=1 Tax=Coturnix japonica TaxID=93934 RepID=A0A8C2YBH0_COTJA
GITAVPLRYGRFDPEDQRSRHCPYLDTINKSVLDFDFEKLCSISLSHINVYACLVCGKYFQGRGLKSHAYIHSVQFSHHVFLNLHTLKFYCLPDNYEIIDSSLEDITYVLKPTFTAQQISNLDKQAKLSRAYDGTTYLPGIVGLNNIKANDYANTALSNVPPLRNYFLEEENYKSIQRPPGDIMFLLVQRFGELMRKLWNPRNFKAHVSPHEMLQAVVLCSKKNFQITKQGDGVDFLSWFLNALHSALGGTKRKKKRTVTPLGSPTHPYEPLGSPCVPWCPPTPPHPVSPIPHLSLCVPVVPRCRDVHVPPVPLRPAVQHQAAHQPRCQLPQQRVQHQHGVTLGQALARARHGQRQRPAQLGHGPGHGPLWQHMELGVTP